VAAWHERARQAARCHFDSAIAGKRALRQGAVTGEIDHDVLTQPPSPFGPQSGNGGPKDGPLPKFNGVTLPVGKTDRLHPLEPIERPSEAGGRVLASRKQDKRCRHDRLIARDSPAISESAKATSQTCFTIKLPL